MERTSGIRIFLNGITRLAKRSWYALYLSSIMAQELCISGR